MDQVSLIITTLPNSTVTQVTFKCLDKERTVYETRKGIIGPSADGLLVRGGRDVEGKTEFDIGKHRYRIFYTGSHLSNQELVSYIALTPIRKG